MAEDWRKPHNEERHHFCSSPNVTGVIQSK